MADDAKQLVRAKMDAIFKAGTNKISADRFKEIWHKYDDDGECLAVCVCFLVILYSSNFSTLPLLTLPARNWILATRTNTSANTLTTLFTRANLLFAPKVLVHLQLLLFKVRQMAPEHLTFDFRVLTHPALTLAGLHLALVSSLSTPFFSFLFSCPFALDNCYGRRHSCLCGCCCCCCSSSFSSS